MTQPDLLSYRAGHPGFKERGGTSQQAAETIKHRAKYLREKIMDLMQTHDDLTADECAALLNENILSIRPRCSELFMAGKLRKTDKRRNRQRAYARAAA